MDKFDSDVLSALTANPMPTYYIRNRVGLSSRDTSRVRSALRRLSASGHAMRRHDSTTFRSMLHWSLPITTKETK